MRVEAVGLCGSDLHWFEEGGIGDTRLTDPVVPGHEFAGVVEGGPLDGRRVAVDPARAVRASASAASKATATSAPRSSSPATATATAACGEYMTWPTAALHPLPDSLDGVAGAMLEPLGVAIHAHDLGHVRLGADVAVVGCGPIGLLIVQVARAAGARVALAVDPLEHRRAAAERAGAELVGGAGGRPRLADRRRRVRGGGQRCGRRPRHARHPARRPRRARGHPGRRPHVVQRRARAPPRPDHRDGRGAWARCIRAPSSSWSAEPST